VGRIWRCQGGRGRMGCRRDDWGRFGHNDRGVKEGDVDVSDRGSADAIAVIRAL
jgi:hypothetical protein